MKYVVLVILSLSFAVSALASEEEERPSYLRKPVEQDHLSVGLSTELRSPFYFGIDTTVDVLPAIDYRYGFFFVDGRTTGIDFIEWENTRWTLFLNYHKEHLDIGDVDGGSSTLYDGLSSRDAALEMALSLTYWGKLFTGKMAIFRDISNEYDSIRALISLDRTFGQVDDDWEYKLGMYLSYNSKQFNRYYYGITAAEAQVDRPEYLTGNSQDFALYTSLSYRFDQDWSVDFYFDYIYLEARVSDSPLIQNTYQWNATIDINYHIF